MKHHAEEAGLDHVKTHDLRRFVGTQFARVDIRKAQKTLRHKRIETTARHYVLDEKDPNPPSPSYAEKPWNPLQRVSGVGSMVTSTRHHRLEGRDAIPIREEGTSAAIILIAGFLRHSIRPGIGQFALKAIIAKQHVGEAFAFS